ncbi:MAG: sensor histidine kinase [Aeromicrobium sp.]
MDEGSVNFQFPEGRRLEFDLLLGQLFERAHEVMETQERLGNLIRATNSVVSDLDLPTVLTRIAESAKQLVGARYAAMGVIGEDGHLEQFIHVGMDDSIVEQIDHLPEGKGLLGALIQDPQPVRLRTISSDQRSSGFPTNHPPMKSFLGVPIRVRDEVYGNLYLTDHVNGEFSADDEELAQALAASAGIAIANARLFEESRYRERWSTALADTNRYMLADEEEDGLQFLIERVLELADADIVCVLHVVHDGDDLVVDRAVGQSADVLLERTFPLEGTVCQEVLSAGHARMVNSGHEYPSHGFLHLAGVKEALLVPFDVSALERGVLAVARSSGRSGFQRRDLDMTASFADQVTLAVQRTRSRENSQWMEILEDRSRIARDLHDHVIQRLFAAGLSLQAIASGLGPGEPAQRITAQIVDIDETIAQIRQSIFALKTDGRNPASGLRARIREVVDRVADQLPISPKLRFLGPVDLMSDREVTDDAAAVVTEALANVVRHAQASSVAVTISAANSELSIDVVDDGKGPGQHPQLSGIANLRHRAQQRGGDMTVQNGKPGGTHLTWSIPF